MWTYLLHFLGIKKNLAITLGQFNSVRDELTAVISQETKAQAKRNAKIAKMNTANSASTAAVERAQTVRTNVQNLLGA
jgi:hypothetical protein